MTRKWKYKNDNMKLKKIFVTLLIIITSLTFIIIGKEVTTYRDTKKQFDFLVKLLNSNDKTIQNGAIRALGKLGDKRAVKLILPLLDDEDLWVRVEAARALGELGDKEAIEPLIYLLNTSVNPPVRRESARSLGLIGDTRAVVPLIIRLKNDNNALVRVKIIEALGILGDRQAIVTVKYYRNEKDIWVRTEAEKTIRKLSK